MLIFLACWICFNSCSFFLINNVINSIIVSVNYDTIDSEEKNPAQIKMEVQYATGTSILCLKSSRLFRIHISISGEKQESYLSRNLPKVSVNYWGKTESISQPSFNFKFCCSGINKEYMFKEEIIGET